MQLNILAKFQYKKTLDRRRKAIRERNMVLNELIKTEEDYVSTLQFMLQDCRQYIVEGLKIPTYQYDQIFGTIQGISLLHSKMLAELHERMRGRAEAGFKIGDILYRYIQFYKIYKDYITQLHSSRNAIINLKSQGKLSKFKSLIEQQRGMLNEKYGQRLMQYLTNTEIQNYINSPNQRLYQYGLLLPRYAKTLNGNSEDTKLISEAIKLYNNVLNKINEDFGQAQLKKCMELENLFGNIVMPHRKFIRSFPASYWDGGNKLLSCRVDIMNDLILIVNENAKKLVRRLRLDSQSWYHQLSVGKHINTAVFLKACDGAAQTLYLSIYNLDEFINMLNRLFCELPRRVSLQNNRPSVLIRPVRISRFGKSFIFTLNIKKNPAKGGVYNSYTITQLYKISQYLVKNHPTANFRLLEEVSKMNRQSVDGSENISEFDAEHIALSLLELFSPLFNNYEILLKDPELQYQLGIRDYVEMVEGRLEEDHSLDELSRDLLVSESRMRATQIDFKNNVQIVISMQSGYKRKIMIGKEERCYSIIRKIMGTSFNMDYGLYINSDKSKMALLDDDDILYRVMCRQGYTFKEDSSMFRRAYSLIVGDLAVTIHLKKYLYLQSPYRQLYDGVDSNRLYFLTDNILSAMYHHKSKMPVTKIAEMLGLVMRIKVQEGITADQQQQLLSNYWRGKVDKSDIPEIEFRELVFQQYGKVATKSTKQCFQRLFTSVQFWNEYAYVVDCLLIETNLKCVLILKHRVIEVRESLQSEVPLLRIDMTDLEYEAWPGELAIKMEDKKIVIAVDWIQGVVLALSRNLYVQKIKSGNLQSI